MHSNRKNIIPLMCVVVAVITVLLCILEDCGIIIYQVNSFTYKGKKIALVESSYNCGFRWKRMTERCLEIAIAKIWLKKNAKNIIEIGAVTPYY